MINDTYAIQLVCIGFKLVKVNQVIAYIKIR
jgi:hypothetical protein